LAEEPTCLSRRPVQYAPRTKRPEPQSLSGVEWAQRLKYDDCTRQRDEPLKAEQDGEEAPRTCRVCVRPAGADADGCDAMQCRLAKRLKLLRFQRARTGRSSRTATDVPVTTTTSTTTRRQRGLAALALAMRGWTRKAARAVSVTLGQRRSQLPGRIGCSRPDAEGARLRGRAFGVAWWLCAVCRSR